MRTSYPVTERVDAVGAVHAIEIELSEWETTVGAASPEGTEEAYDKTVLLFLLSPISLIAVT